MLQSYDFIGARQIDALGNFIYVDTVSAGGLDDAIVVSRDGVALGLLRPGEGVSVDRQDRSSRWNLAPVTPSARGFVRIGFGRFITNRIKGEVSVIDGVRESVETRTSLDNSLAFGAVAMVLPAANLRGILVRAMLVEAQGGSGGTANARVIAAPVQPVGMVPGANSIMLISAFSSGNADVSRAADFTVARLVPAGWGLWHCKNNSAVAATQNSVTASFEVL